MDPIWNYLICALQAYLLGSLIWGVIISKLKYGKDLRDYGSKNAGMTNMLRVFGKGAAAAVFLCDSLKGVAAVLLAKRLLCGRADALVCGYIAAFFVVVGHMFPVFFRFRGGKGSATGIGAATALAWQTFPLVMALFLLVVGMSKMVSLASVLSALWLPFATLLIYRLWYPQVSPLVPTIATAAIAVLVIFRHRSNIRRIVKGTENKLGK